MGKKRIAQETKEDVAKEAKLVAEKRAKRVSAAAKKGIRKGRIYIDASYNNTFITVTDEAGNTVAWMSAGSLGYSGPKKATPFAASKVSEAIGEKLQKTGPFEVDVFVKGVGSGRDSALRSLAVQGFDIKSISDITPIPHGGPRPRKARRV